MKLFTEVLQLDSQKNSKSFIQKTQEVTEVGSKLGWYTIMLTMEQIKMLLGVFKTIKTQK